MATLTDPSDNKLSDGAWAAGVKVKAPDGYLISSTCNGNYTGDFAVETEGQTEVSYYLKETATGYISAEKKIAATKRAFGYPRFWAVRKAKLSKSWKTE